MLKVRMGMLAAAVVATAGLIVTINVALAADNSDIKSIAALIQKGDMAGAKKAAAKYAKANPDVEDLMTAFKTAKKKGLGVTGTDNSIEQALITTGRDAPAGPKMAKMASAYEEMGYNIAAVGLITEALAPEKDMGAKKTRKAWIEYAVGMTEAGLKVAAAGKAQSGADFKTHASKVNASCNNCHTNFK